MHPGRRRYLHSPLNKLKRGLVAYWSLDGASTLDSSSTLTDLRGPYDLTNNNGVSVAAGPSNTLSSSADLEDTSSQYLHVTDKVSFNPSNGFSVAGWVYHESEGAGGTIDTIISQYDASGGDRSWWLRHDVSSDRFVFVTAQNGAGAGLVTLLANTAGNINTGQWYFVHAYFDKRRGKVGISVNAGTPDEATQTAVHNSAGWLEVGSRNIIDLWDGRLCHIALACGRVFTRTEIHWLYNNGVGRDLGRM